MSIVHNLTEAAKGLVEIDQAGELPALGDEIKRAYRDWKHEHLNRAIGERIYIDGLAKIPTVDGIDGHEAWSAVARSREADVGSCSLPHHHSLCGPIADSTEAQCMTTEIRFDIGAPETQGKRLVKAFHGAELLTQERFDVFQAWQATPFLQKVTDRIPITANYDSPTDALAFVCGDFEEAIKNIADGCADEIARPVLCPMSEVQSREIAWLWPNRFALGKLSLLIGEPGNGKSYWSLDTAARISIASPWPDGSGNAPLGSVLLMGVEDDLADTVKPRLEAAGADVAKIVALTGVANKDDEGQHERTVDLRRDIPILDAALQRYPDTRAIIIDPISAFMGKTDSHVNAEVRETLAPLCNWPSGMPWQSLPSRTCAKASRRRCIERWAAWHSLRRHDVFGRLPKTSAIQKAVAGCCCQLNRTSVRIWAAWRSR